MITLDILVPIAAKGALVLLLAAACCDSSCSIARRRSGTWCGPGGLFALLLMPVLSFMLPTLPVPGLAASSPVEAPRESPRFAGMTASSGDSVARHRR